MNMSGSALMQPWGVLALLLALCPGLNKMCVAQLAATTRSSPPDLDKQPLQQKRLCTVRLECVSVQSRDCSHGSDLKHTPNARCRSHFCCSC